MVRISTQLTFEDRPYVVNSPDFPPYPKKYPGILGLCGGTGTGRIFRIQTRLAALFGEVAVCMFPTPALDGAGFTAWNAGLDFNPDVDDVGYLTRFINMMIRTGRVDPNNLWIIGHSLGGMMANRMAIEQPQRWRGVYSMSGNVLVDNPNTYYGKIKETHGLLDVNVPFNGGIGINGVNYPNIPAVYSQYKKASFELNALPFAQHTMPYIRQGYIDQGTTLQQDIFNFIFG